VKKGSTLSQKKSKPAQWEVNVSTRIGHDPLLDCLVLLSEHFSTPCSAEALAAGLPLTNQFLSPELVPQAASRAGLSAKLDRRSLTSLPDMLLPCILMLKNKRACILHELDSTKNQVRVSFPETGGEARLSIEELESEYVGYLFLIKQKYHGDRHFDVHIQETTEHWLWNSIRESAPIYRDVIIASILINIFALLSPLFIMNVYDKVVPNLAFETLWVLAIGASVAYVFDFILKQIRAYLIDVAGKKVDVEISSKLFAKAIGIPLEKRSSSIGGMARQLGEFDSIRDFLSSATITALVDLPFSILFIFIIWLVAGDLAIFSVIAAILIVGYSLTVQPRLKVAIEEANKFSGLRHGHLVESLSSLESIKANGAEGLSNVSSFVIQMTVIAVVILGVYRVSEGLISMGAIIAAVMLSSRAIAPMGRIAGLMTRYNQTMSSLRQIDGIMKQESEFENKGHLVSRNKLEGNIECEQVSFKYPNNEKTALYPFSLKIKPGEKIAIIGRNGSGKTTLAKLILGLYKPLLGSIRYDGLHQEQIHPSDLRSNIGYLPQDITLFHGSIKDNILFGTRQVTEYQLLRAAQLSGVCLFTDLASEGLDLQVGEGGISLSRGQRQAVALARAILNNPQVLLLDEPTASLDARSEKQFILSMKQTIKERSLLLITHKMHLLQLVDRIIIVDNGKIAADGPKDVVLEQLSAGKFAAEKGAES